MDSLVAGTLIKTKRGEVKIEDVVKDDFVLTRKGWKLVLFSGMTAEAKEVYTVTFSNGKSITGTADHLIWVKGKGFVFLNACRYADIIEVWKGKQLSITAKSITAILKHLIGQTRCTIERRGNAKTGTLVKTILMQFVNGVRGLSKRINIDKENVALVYVLNVSEPHELKQSVYDITTQDIPEFYANGVLVHNSRRYSVASYRGHSGRRGILSIGW